MTAKNGALVLIKVGDGAMTESFATVGGLRTSRMLVNAQVIDNSDVETGAWRSLMDAGIRHVLISGSGIFTDSAAEESLRGYAFAGAIHNYRFVFANGDTITGPFLVSHYERSGDHDSEEIYSLTLESAGDIAFAG